MDTDSTLHVKVLPYMWLWDMTHRSRKWVGSWHQKQTRIKLLKCISPEAATECQGKFSSSWIFLADTGRVADAWKHRPCRPGQEKMASDEVPAKLQCFDWEGEKQGSLTRRMRCVIDISVGTIRKKDSSNVRHCHDTRPSLVIQTETNWTSEAVYLRLTQLI